MMPTNLRRDLVLTLILVFLPRIWDVPKIASMG